MRNLIRHVEFDGYRIKLYETGKTNSRGFKNMTYHLYAYEFFTPKGQLLFSGEEYSPAPSYDPLGDEAMRELVGFLTLSPGDTEDEYFKDYTPAQMEFANGPAEELSICSIDPDDEENAMTFADLEVTA